MAEMTDEHKDNKRPPLSSVPMSYGVSCVKGIEWCSLHNLGGTAAKAVP